uniref:beta strand repeat-containing protein n=3 Tax=Flavobacterium sp. TaxID=239 RepID=UPI00404AA5E0
MKEKIIFLLLLFSSLFEMNAQITETFEGINNGSSSFVNGSFVANLAPSSFLVGQILNYGYNSSDRFIENVNSTSGTISANTTFYVSSLYLYPSTDLGNNNQTSNVSVTFIGKLNGINQFTYTPPSADFSAASYSNPVNRGFSLVNFAAVGYQNTLINELVVTIGNSGNYIAIDNFTFTPVTSLPPTVTTDSQSNVTTTSAILGGNVTSPGSSNVVDRGIVWSTTSTPTVLNNKVQIGTGIGLFSQNITNLPSNTLIYVRAYAISNAGTSYGEQITFTTLVDCNLTASPQSQTNVSCFGASTGSATVQVSGGSAPYTYSWSPSGGSQATATGLSAGVYVVTVEDSNGCSDTQSFTITQPASGVNASPAMQTNIACFGGSNGSATVQVSGGSAPYTYSWSPSGGSQATATGLSAGVYVVTVEDATGCSDTQSFTITQPASGVNASPASQTNIACFGGSNGSATVQVSGGSAPYTYSWSPSGGSQAFANGLSAGDYVVTVQDSNGCTDTQSFTITQPDILVSSIESQTNIGCGEPNLGSATVAVSGGTAPYFYSWSPSGGSDATATGLSAGTYTVTITDSNSCQTSQEITITEVESPTLTANDTETICTDESVTLSPTTNAINTQGFVGDFASTNWTQSSQSSNGSITFNETDAIMISSDGLSGLGFNQAVITIPYNTTISFDWNYTTVDGAQYDYPQIFLNGNLQFINGYSTLGSFTQSGTQTITLEAGDLFGFRMVSTDNTLGAATTTINNFQVQTTQYQWVASNGGSIDGASDQLNLEVSTAGTYTLTVTTSQGCSASKSIEVVESQTAVPTVDNQVIYSATATVADLTAVGENLAWYASETSETALSSETALVSGTYYVSQTTNGCESARAAFEVTIVPVGIEATSCNTTLNSAFYD